VIEYLSVDQVLTLHALQIRRYGGASALRDRGALDAAVTRPQMTFAGEDLYPDVAAKAAALMHSLVMNHPFVDGNKRAGAHAALLFLYANGFESLIARAELTRMTVGVAAGEIEAEALAIWLRQRIRPRER